MERGQGLTFILIHYSFFPLSTCWVPSTVSSLFQVLIHLIPAAIQSSDFYWPGLSYQLMAELELEPRPSGL